MNGQDYLNHYSATLLQLDHNVTYTVIHYDMSMTKFHKNLCNMFMVNTKRIVRQFLGKHPCGYFFKGIKNCAYSCYVFGKGTMCVYVFLFVFVYHQNYESCKTFLNLLNICADNIVQEEKVQ